MKIDLNDATAVRSRYIGVELIEKLNGSGQILYDRTGRAILPPDCITFSEMGMPWIDKYILEAYERPRIFTIMMANAENGKFMSELDDFLGNSSILKVTQWQAILYRSGLYENVHRRYRSSKSHFSSFSEWGDPNHQMICIDQDFLIASWAFVDSFLARSSDNPNDPYDHFLRLVVETESAISWNDVQLSGTRKILKSMLNKGEKTNLSEAFHLSKKNSADIMKSMGLSKVKELNEYVYSPVYYAAGHGNEKWLEPFMDWARSIVFHFIIGHEIGHVSYFQRKKNLKVEESIKYIKKISGANQDGIVEECYCDWVAMNNCLFQAKKFGIPLGFVVLMINVTWGLASFRRKSNLDEKTTSYRLNSMNQGLLDVLGSSNHDDLLKLFRIIESRVTPAILFISEKMKDIGILNIALNPKDEDRTRLLEEPSKMMSLYAVK